jgi:hypothetical protein
VTVEGVQGGEEFRRQGQGIKGRCLAPAFFWHLGADEFPEPAVLGHIAAMTVVLPAPAAILRQIRSSSGFASALAFFRCSRKLFSGLPARGTTSVSQMRVSATSIWQKKGRIPVN